MWKKLLAGAVSAGAGSALANPFDLVKFRLQADTATDPLLRRHNGGWGGAGPTVMGATVGGMSELPVYDEMKHQLIARDILTRG